MSTGEKIDHMLKELDKQAKTIVLCHHGRRSMFVCDILDKKGFKDVNNVVGGIDSYSINIDSSIKRY